MHGLLLVRLEVDERVLLLRLPHARLLRNVQRAWQICVDVRRPDTMLSIDDGLLIMPQQRRARLHAVRRHTPDSDRREGRRGSTHASAPQMTIGGNGRVGMLTVTLRQHGGRPSGAREGQHGGRLGSATTRRARRLPLRRDHEA